jgi:aspartyl/glutamyl-tRNA(Asn/Gln) amidotransferase C subunit
VVDTALVLKLAASAHIALEREEVERLAAQLTDILSQIAPLADLADTEVPRPARAEGVTLRSDEPGGDPMTGSITRFAPEVKEGFFTVPRLPARGAP